MGHHDAVLNSWVGRIGRGAATIWVGGLLACFTASPAQAALGLPAESVNADQAQFGGELRSTLGEGFLVEEITTPGCVVREYVAPGGTVFAVSWRGISTPDLAQLLGPHFADLEQATPTSTRRRRSLVVRTPGFVLEMGGHVRYMHGRAYLPGSLPEAVSEEMVK